MMKSPVGALVAYSADGWRFFIPVILTECSCQLDISLDA